MAQVNPTVSVNEEIFTQAIAEKNGGVKVTPKMDSLSIDFECNSYPGYSGGFAISGPIKCDKGFKVRFDLRSPRQGETDWWGTYVYLVEHG